MKLVSYSSVYYDINSVVSTTVFITQANYIGVLIKVSNFFFYAGYLYFLLCDL